VNVLLGRQCPMLQFQHISGVLWAWSQVRHMGGTLGYAPGG
jgi:hypothetical protein